MSVMIKCRRCGQEYAQSEMRLDANGSDMLCKNCYSRTHDHKGKKLVVASYEDPEDDFVMLRPPSPKPDKPSGPQIKKYLCTKCNFRFSRDASKVISQCPYCGDSKLISDDKLAADNLLKEASHTKYEY